MLVGERSALAEGIVAACGRSSLSPDVSFGVDWSKGSGFEGQETFSPEIFRLPGARLLAFRYFTIYSQAARVELDLMPETGGCG